MLRRQHRRRRPKKKRKLRGQVTYQLELLSLSRSLKKLVKELMKHEARRNLPMT